jgi:uncharacterized protein (DUF1684 family)
MEGITMSRVHINEQVTVTAVGFRKNLIAYPRRMEFRGITYNFIDAGLRCLVRHSDRIAEILTLSDGKANYHMRSDNCGNNWTLLSIVS